MGGRGSIPGAGPTLESLNNWEIKVLPLHCTSSGSNDHVKWNSGGSMGGTGGLGPHLFLDQTEARRAEKFF